MGNRTYLNGRAKCPLYERVVYSGQNYKIAGVQCECIAGGFGFPVSTIVRVTGYKGLRQLKGTYCDSIRGYQLCPYYRAYMDAKKKTGD